LYCCRKNLKGCNVLSSAQQAWPFNAVVADEKYCRSIEKTSKPVLVSGITNLQILQRNEVSSVVWQLLVDDRDVKQADTITLIGDHAVTRQYRAKATIYIYIV
jgi:hypothetical protein